MKLPSQTELLLPLLDTVKSHGGTVRPGEIYDELAAKLGIDDETRNATVRLNGRNVNEWERRVRWVRQTAVVKEYMSGNTRGIWDLTDAGYYALRNARRGTIVTVYQSESGVVVWANVEDAIGIVERGSVQTIISSPPYPLLKPKAYGNLESRAWLDWMLSLCEGFRELLTEDGSLFLNLGTVFQSGRPTVDLYIERFTIEMADKLGYHLAQRFEWYNPCKLPQPMEWVSIKRVRVKPSTETVLWMSPSPNPKADNRKVLVPYSKSMQRVLASGQKKEKRPSGAWISEAFGNNNGGAIPSNLIIAANASSNDAYHRACRESGLTAHPATFPKALPKFCLELTTDKGDRCADFFGGSLTTAQVAEELGLNYFVSDRSLTYLEAGVARLRAA
jgi:site-specific DNA-methyltransferase (cytosine-N4-specific)